jgi:uncharacterized protein (TIGR02099 family)
MVKKSFIWLYSITTWLLWIAVILIAVVVLGLRYYLLPHIEDYKDKIAQEASSIAGQKITIGSIEAGWDGMQPQLDLFKVDLYDAQNRVALSLDHIETNLSWLSLALGDVRLSSLTINKPALTVRREKDGSIYVAGIPMSGPSRPEFPNWLLRQSLVDILDASVLWQDDFRGAPPLELRNLSLRLTSPAWARVFEQHKFGLRATPSAGSSKPIEIRGDLTGSDVSHPEEWSGTIYAHMEGTDISAWSNWVSYPFDLRKGYGAAQLWLDFSQSKADSITAHVQLSDVTIQPSQNSRALGLRNVSGRIEWSRLKDGYEIHANQLKLLTADGLDVQNGSAHLISRLINAKAMTDGEVSLDEANLEQIATFASTLPLEARLLERIRGFSPRGKLQQLHLTWSGESSSIAKYALRGRFRELGIDPYESVPGFSGLVGTVDASQDGGTLRLDTTRALIDLKDVLRWPIKDNKLNGEIKWTNKNGDLALTANALSIANPHLAATFNVSYQSTEKGSGVIDLSGNISRADAKYAPFYLPKTLSKDTLHWVDTSVLAGKSSNVNIIVKGNLDEFPWPDNKRGLFQIKGTVTQGFLDYADNWPRVEDIQAGLLFQGQRMELNATRGHLLGNQIINTKAVIPDLDALHPVLKLTGELQSPAAEAIKYINKSPLLDATDRFTEHMQASGDGKLLLDLEIPLDTEGVGSKVKGSYLVTNGRLIGNDDMPTIDDINGRLDFTESSVRAQNVNAQIFGGAAQFSLENSKDDLLHVTAKGRIADTGIRQMAASPFTDKLHGNTDWTADINLRKTGADLLIKSSLAGLSSSLPEPFNKSVESALPLVMEKKAQNAGQDTISFRLGNVASAQMLRSTHGEAMRIDRGEIVFGDKAGIPAKPGIGIRGSLAYVDIDKWQALANEVENKKSGEKSDIRINYVNLSIGTLDVLERRITALKLDANAISNGWKSTLQADEINGEVQLLQKSGRDKVMARLKLLSVPPLAPASLSAQPASPQKPTEYPTLDIVAEEFNIPDKKLGKLEFFAEPQGDDWNIEKLIISNPDSTLTIDGKFKNWRSNPATSFNLTWSISDIGKTMERYNYPDSFRGGKGTISGQLSWPGPIRAYDPSILDGNLSISAEKGQILKIKQGVGRLFSILSLQNLPRRLTFDFRDVFSEGFIYDKINSRLIAKQGIVQIDKFRMEGPAAKVQMDGETNLVKETQNLHVKVTPAISGSASLAAFAGGPVVGAAAFVAQKILRDPLDKLAAYEFDIVGTWADPKEASSKKTPVEPAQNELPFGN